MQLVSEMGAEGARASGGEPERVAGRYDLVERIAQGGMGEVHVARELATGRRLALKRLLPAATKRSALFRAEYHTLARLKHPYIIEVYDFGVDRELPYYTMELLDGYDLRECPQVSLRESCQILRDVACSLSLLHAQKLLHRDISPRNVRRTSSGLCKLIDFGTMAPFGVAPNVAGTPPFISPEAWEGALLDQRADLYSLGALAYWLFSRRLPGSARSLDRGPGPREAPPLLGRVARAIPPELEELVMSLLEFDPSRRPASAAEVIARLTGIAGLPALDMPLLARSHLGSSGFVGQRRMLVSVEKQLACALLGDGGGLLVEGAEGTGKSRLLQELSVLGQTKGFSVVRAFAGRATAGAHAARELYRGLRRAAPEVFELLPEPERSLLANFDWQENSASSLAPAETRARLQEALAAYFELVAKAGPWLVLVDDLDQADEFSAAFVSALAARARAQPILVVGSCAPAGQRPEAHPLSALRARASLLSLADLDEKATRALVSNLFGRVRNRGRLVSFLYREACGNPGLTMELCSWLLDRGLIRYHDGAFVLPESEIREELPPGTARTLMLRLEGLGPVARELVDLLATCRGGASLELCLSAWPGATEELFSGMQELVSRGILVGSGSSYVFAQEALRSSVRGGLSEERQRAQHGLLAPAYLKLARAGPLEQLEAAWHLVHTERELEGAELLYRVTPALTESGITSQDAIRGLEKALEVFERRGVSLEKALDIRAQLARAAYLYDYRLAERHAARTIRMLADWCGLSIVERWERFIPASVALLACSLIMVVRRLFWPPDARGPRPHVALSVLSRAVLSTMGVRLTALDGPAAQALLRHMRFFGSISPRLSAAPVVYRAARALCLQPFGREAELASALARAQQALDELRRPELSDLERWDIRVGLMLSGGINECYRIGSKALDRATELEAVGTRMARAAAHRIRFTYYAVRGMREKAEQFRRELDIHGIQGGTTWQVDWFAVPTEGMASALLGDLMGAGQALSRLERLASEIPSLAPMRDMVKMGYHLRRGEYARAVEMGEEFVARHAPRSIIGWGAAYATYAAALNQSGQHRKAAAVCESALALLSAADREYIVMYGPLVRELGSAWAGLRELPRALALGDETIARLTEVGEHALLAHAHEHRALIARGARDHSLLAHALVSMRDAAELAGSTTVIEQAAKVTQANLRATSDVDVSSLVSDLVTPVSDLRSGETPAGGFGRSRRRLLLQRVMERAQAEAALVFAASASGEACLVASAGRAQPAEALRALVAPLLARDPDELAEIEPPPFELEGRRYEVLCLPRLRRLDRAALVVLVRGRAPDDEVPMTMLARLAERVQSELSVTGDVEESLPDSDVFEPEA
jgi:tetratricopeptide (TPR) repeat protein